MPPELTKVIGIEEENNPSVALGTCCFQSYDYTDLSGFDEDNYYRQFLDQLYLAAMEQCPGERTSGDAANCRPNHKMSSGHHKTVNRCECVECIDGNQWTVSTLHYCTTRLVASALKLDVLTADSWRISGENLSLFLSTTVTEKPTINIIFNDCMRVLVRQYEDYNKSFSHQDVDITTNRYSVTFRSDSVNFTSSSNLLTYSLDKSGCKTKFCNLRYCGQMDFVTKQFHYELNRCKSGKSPARCWGEELAKAGKLKMDPAKQQWSVDDRLLVSESSNGNVCITNTGCNLYLSIQSDQESLCLQLATVCIILGRSGNLFVGHKPANKSETSGNKCLDLITQQIRLLDRSNQQATDEQGGDEESKQSQQQQQSATGDAHCAMSTFQLNKSLMDCFSQYAVCGVSGLLVKHFNRRAGLNQRSQICLL